MIMAPAKQQVAGERLPVPEGVHQLLQRHAQTRQAIPVRPLLIALGHSLEETFAEASQRVRLHVSADPVTLSWDHTNALALLATEAISNAYNHAFPGKRSGMIAVSFSRSVDAMVLEIRDNGAGMSGAGRPGSSGLNLMRGLAMRLSAAISFAPMGGDSGTFVRLWIPAPGKFSGGVQAASCDRRVPVRARSAGAPMLLHRYRWARARSIHPSAEPSMNPSASAAASAASSMRNVLATSGCVRVSSTSHVSRSYGSRSST